MARKLLTFAAALGLLLVTALPAGAIQFGEPDTGPERYNGVVEILFFDGDGPSHLCSGTLIDGDSVLTAGHCTFDTVFALVGFDQSYPDAGSFLGTATPGFAVTHPDFAFPFNDLGVVNLIAPAPGSTTIWGLAPVGTLDPLQSKKGKQNTQGVVTGYGVQDQLPPDISPFFPLERHRGDVKITNVHSPGLNGLFGTVQLSANPGKPHSGGTCFGDSGGPLLYDSSSGLEIAAVTSFGLNGQCMGNGFSQRVDNDAAQTWIWSVANDA